ncbi:Protein MAIN-LIKE 2 [Linum perenne]
MTPNCRYSKKIVKYDPRFEPYLAPIGLDKLRDCLDFTPDPELITALVERWRPETSTFHLYHGEATITLEDVHFITGLSVDGELVESQRRLPTVDSDMQNYVLELLGKKPSTGTIRGDADPETIEQHCRAYILDFFGRCIFADRSGSHAPLFFLPLLEDMSQIGEYAWGAAALSWLYRELGRCAIRIESSPTRDHVGDIEGWMALVQAWALERFTSFARRVHKSRQIAPTHSPIPRMTKLGLQLLSCSYFIPSDQVL